MRHCCAEQRGKKSQNQKKMLRQTLQRYEERQERRKRWDEPDIDVRTEQHDSRPHAHRVVSDELLCCLADKCAAVHKVYSDYDRRRAARPYQQEDYCLEAKCRYRHDMHAPLSDCVSCAALSAAHNERVAGAILCAGCTAATAEQCPPQVPCHNRFRRNVISTAGTWIDGYVKQQERHRRLTYGSERDLIAYNTLAQWKHEIDQGYPSTACANDCIA